MSQRSLTKAPVLMIRFTVTAVSAVLFFIDKIKISIFLFKELNKFECFWCSIIFA